MVTEQWRKFFWLFTLTFAVSAIAFFIFSQGVPYANAIDPSAQRLPPTCIFNREMIGECSPSVPESNRQGKEVPGGCADICKTAGGIPLRYGDIKIVGPGDGAFVDDGKLYCFDAKKELECKGTNVLTGSGVAGGTTTATSVTTNKQITQKEAEDRGKDKCGIFSSVGCWILQAINVVINLFATLLNTVAGSIAALLGGLAGLLQKGMMLVIDSFMGIPVSPSNAQSPLFVQQAWAIVRDLANNFFILILAFIGLATILRLQAYQLQKTLPALLLVALLVNFSGVLVGLVADVGNIITSNFLRLAGNVAWENATHPNWGGGTAGLGISIVQIVYYFVSSLIYLGVMFAFGLRTIVLWTLAIVAPLAFVAYILPATRGLATGWWKQLIQWALFGIPLSFFLFLASLTLNTTGIPSNITIGTVSNLMAPFTTLFLLFTGITMSMALAPAAAQGVGKFGAQLGLKGAMGLGSFASRKIPLGKFGENMRKRGQGIEVAEADKTRLERWGGAVLGTIPGMDRLGSAINMPVLQKRKDETRARIDELEAKKRKNHGRLNKKDADELKQKKLDLENVNAQISTASAGWATQGVAWFTRRGATVFGRGMEMAGKELEMRTGVKDEREYQQGVKDVGAKDSSQVFNMINEELAKGPLANWNRVVGMLNGVRNRGDADDIEDALKAGQLNKKVIGGVIKQGRRMGPPGFRPLLKSFLGDIMVNSQEFGFDATRDKATGKWEGKDAELLTKDLGIERIASKFTAQDWQGDTLAPQNFNMDTEQGKLFMQLMIKERGADFIGQIARRPRKAEGAAAMQYIFKEGKYAKDGLGIDWLLDNNAEDVLRYLDSPGARSLGLGRNITRRQIEMWIEQKQQGQTPSNLSEEQVRLEVERGEQEPLSQNQLLPPRERNRAGNRVQEIDRRIQQIGDRLNLMDEDTTPTQGLLNDVERLQNEIAQATQAIELDETNLQAYRNRATADRELRPRQLELNRRGIILPTTPQEQSYTTLLEQSTQQQAQLQNLQQELERLEQQGRSTTGVFLPSIQKIRGEIEQTTQQLRQTEQQIGSLEIELGRVPSPPAPMPEIQPNMPDPLKRLISQGNTEINTITEWTRELQGNLTDIRESQEDLAEITQAMAGLSKELNELNTQNQAGTLAPQLQARIPDLQGEIQRLQGRETVLAQQRNTSQGAAAKAREEILTSKQKVDGPDGIRERIGAQAEPLKRKYERTQRAQRREQRLKQR